MGDRYILAVRTVDEGEFGGFRTAREVERDLAAARDGVGYLRFEVAGVAVAIPGRSVVRVTTCDLSRERTVRDWSNAMSLMGIHVQGSWTGEDWGSDATYSWREFRSRWNWSSVAGPFGFASELWERTGDDAQD